MTTSNAKPTSTKSTPLVCSGHTRPVPSIAFSPLQSDGSYLLISSCKDGKAMLRDGSTGDWWGTFIGHKGAVWSAKLDGQGARAMTGSADFSAKIWDTFDGTEVLSLTHNHVVRAVDMTRDGKKAVTGDQERKLRLYDLEKPEDPDIFISSGSTTAHEGTVRSTVVDDNCTQVISAGEDRTVRWWDTRTRECIHTITYPNPIVSLDRSVESSLLAVASGKTVQFLDIASRQVTINHELSYAPSSASLHPLGNHDTFVSGSTGDGWVRVHATDTGDQIELYKGHHGPVHCISYSPDGALYCSGSEDGTLRLWQTQPGDYGLWRLRNGPNSNGHHS